MIVHGGYLLPAALAAVAGLALAVSVHVPEVLLDPPSFGVALARSGAVVAVPSLLALLAAGLLMLRSSWLGLWWAASGGLGLVLVGLWAGGIGVPVLAGLLFAGYAVAGPLCAAAWTVAQRPGVLGWVGAAGLVLTGLRSAVWLLDTRLDPAGGWYITSAGLTLAALLGYPIWLVWLAAPRWRLVTVPLVMAHIAVTLFGTPTPRSADVPAVPSAAGSLRYAVMLGLADVFAQPTTYPALVAARQRAEFTHPRYPAGIAMRTVDADGVPGEYLCAPGASSERVALYIPGGGFVMPPDNAVRGFAATVSRRTGACVLLMHYRLAPEHPYPAARLDTVTAYRWLRKHGAARIAIFGDSAGGNLTLTTALALRAGGDPSPVALVSISGVTDLTLTGPTIRSKERAEPLLTRAHRDLVVRSYVGRTDPRDPLLSPLYSDPAGLPPTLLQVGSQEVLLSDVTRMADRMRAAGVPVRLEVWPGMPHSWNSARKPTMETRLAVQHLSDFIAGHLR